MKINRPIIILILFSSLRFINLDLIPIFGDEALYLSLSDEISIDPKKNYLNSIAYGVFPILVWIQAILFKIIPDFINPLIIGRSVSIIADLGSALILMKLGENILNHRFGLFSGLVYLILPLTFFHGRFSLLESVTNLFALISVFFFYYSLRTLSSKNKLFLYVFLTILFLLLSFFTKPLIAIYIPIYFLLPFLFIDNKTRKRDIFRFYLLPLFILIISLIIIMFFYLPVSGIFSRYIANTNLSLTGKLLYLKQNLFRASWWFDVYITFPLIILLLITFVYGVIKKSLLVLIFTLYFLGSLILACFFSARFYPRHLFALAIPISLLLSLLLEFKKPKIFQFFLFLAFLPVFMFDIKLLFMPNNAKLALEDNQQFYTDWSSGVNMKQISLRLNEFSEKEKITVFVENEPSQFWVLTKLYPVNNAAIIPSDNLFLGKFLESNLIPNDNSTKFIVINRDASNISSWPVKKVASYPKGNYREISIYQLKSF